MVAYYKKIRIGSSCPICRTCVLNWALYTRHSKAVQMFGQPMVNTDGHPTVVSWNFTLGFENVSTFVWSGWVRSKSTVHHRLKIQPVALPTDACVLSHRRAWWFRTHTSENGCGISMQIWRYTLPSSKIWDTIHSFWWKQWLVCPRKTLNLFILQFGP